MKQTQTTQNSPVKRHVVLDHTTPSRLIRVNTVLERCSFSKSELYRRLKEGNFPAPVRLGIRSIAFLESDIEAYILSLANKGAK